MYINTNLQDYLETSSSVNSKSLIVSEWNMNLKDNILQIGNYRYRPYLVSGAYSSIATTFDPADEDNDYTGATESQIATITGVEAITKKPTIFSTKAQKEEQLYSLEETVGRFRPRSGINKIRFFGDNFMNYPNSNMDVQPRFYLSSKDDIFKYWTSYRVENDYYSNYPEVDYSIERGVGKKIVQPGEYWIDDAAPFVVYKTPIPANRIVVKMQTGVGDYDLSPNAQGYKKNNNEVMPDPFYEAPNNVFPLENQKTPLSWKIQYLNTDSQWVTATTFLYDTVRANSKRIIGSDGYVEIAYGITNSPIPFKLLGEFASQYALPLSPATGDAYIVPDSSGATSGTLYIWNETEWDSVVPTYGWYLAEDLSISTSRVTKLTEPDYFGTATTKYSPTYREFQYIKGIRIVVETITQNGASFDLIEMSPRLVADITDSITGYKVTKIASDIGNTGIPVGQLLASTGSLDIFDYSQAFNEYNVSRVESGKVVGSLLFHKDVDNNLFEISSRNLQVKIYEEIIDDRNFPTENHYFVPVKTLYVDGTPQISNTDRKVSLTLRDLFFYFESINAPRILLRNISTSYAIAMLLDSIGFSNYKFFRNPEEKEDRIPYFFIPPDTNVAQVLNSIAQSTQTAMFFDENNNFVTMSRNYIMPNEGERTTPAPLTMYGTKDYQENGAVKNDSLNDKLANIISLDSEDNIVYNGGKITYMNRYIQKSYSTIKEASMLNRSQSYKHKPVLLWEVSGTEALRPVNDEVSNQSSYSLSALSLNANLTDELPYVDNEGIIQNNVMDFGQSIYWLTRYTGYLYANSEIIKYDAVEHTVSGLGNVWIEDISDYRKYFAKIPFNGKMFPTGRVRIYAEPKFDADGDVLPGEVAKHGRMQFGTGVKDTSSAIAVNKPAKHAILSDDNPWMNPDARKTYLMKSEYIFQGEHQYSETSYFKNVNTTANSEVLTGAEPGSVAANFFVRSYKSAAVKVATPAFTTGNLVNIETAAAHKFKAGERVRISGVSPDAYNGDFDIISVEASKFKVKNEKITAATPIEVSGKSEILYNSLIPDDWANSIFPKGTVIKSIDASANTITLSAKATKTTTDSAVAFTNRQVETLSNDANGIRYTESKPSVETLIKDFFDSSEYSESENSKTMDKTKPNGSLKSSALIITGPGNVKPDKPIIIHAFSGNGTEIVFQTSSPNKLLKGDTVFVSNLSENNGTWVVESATNESFTVLGSNTTTMREESGVGEKQLVAYNDTMSYVYKDYSDIPNAESFGTRVRIVGKPIVSSKEAMNEATQIPLGSELIQTVYKNKESYDIQGTGAGIAINMSHKNAIITGYSNGEYTTSQPHTFLLGDTVDISGIVSNSSKTISGAIGVNGQITYTLDNKDGAFAIGKAVTSSGVVATMVANVIYAEGIGTTATYYLDRVDERLTVNSPVSIEGLTGLKVGNTTPNFNIAKTANKVVASVSTVSKKFGADKAAKTVTAFTVASTISGKTDYKKPGKIYSVNGVLGLGLNCTNAEIVNASPTSISVNSEIVGESIVDAKNYGVPGLANSNQTNNLNSTSAEIIAINGENKFTVANPSADEYSFGGICKVDSPVGYYFEIVALTSSTLTNTSDSNKKSETIPNVYFYKVMKGTESKEAIPYVLWYGSAQILVDNGLFVGQAKSVTSSTSTVYDLSVEVDNAYPVDTLMTVDGELKLVTENIGRAFYLYINGNLVQTVVDEDPIEITDENKNMALFVRGRGKALFEHVYVVGENPSTPSQNSNGPLRSKTAFFDQKLDNNNYRKYLLNPSILKTYIEGLGASEQPKYSLYFEEFGTIMRECAYFNVRYEKAYPALYSKISPTFNDSQGYVVSNFRANPYGAEFLVFNATDFAINLDESTGNYLRIQGVTFTQQSSHDLTVDEYFSKISDSNNFENYSSYNEGFKALQNSRSTYGKKDFTLSGDYIQNADTANSLMQWMTEKVMKKRKSVKLSIFSNPMIQLGDIVTIDYDIDTTQQVSNSRFVVYHIEHSRDDKGPKMNIYLSEVI